MFQHELLPIQFIDKHYKKPTVTETDSEVNHFSNFLILCKRLFIMFDFVHFLPNKSVSHSCKNQERKAAYHDFNTIALYYAYHTMVCVSLKNEDPIANNLMARC